MKIKCYKKAIYCSKSDLTIWWNVFLFCVGRLKEKVEQNMEDYDLCSYKNKISEAFSL